MESREREAFLAYSHLPKFKRRVAEALEVIQEALAIAPSYCAVSWGKDSVVMLHLCQQLESDILAVNIADEYQHLQDSYAQVELDYVGRFKPNLQKIISTDGKFNPIYQQLKSSTPMALVGCRAEESKVRKMAICKYGLIHQYDDGRHRAFPLAWWKWQDVWAYICLNDLPYLRSYDAIISGDRSESRSAIIHGFNLHKRTHLEGIVAEKSLFSKLKQTSPEYYQLYCELFPEVRSLG